MKKLLLAILAVFPLLTHAAGFDANEFNSDNSSVRDIDPNTINLADGKEHICKYILPYESGSIIKDNELYKPRYAFYGYIQRLHHSCNIYSIKTLDYNNMSIEFINAILEAMRNQFDWQWYNSQRQKIDGYSEDPIDYTDDPLAHVMYVQGRAVNMEELKRLFKELPGLFGWWIY